MRSKLVPLLLSFASFAGLSCTSSGLGGEPAGTGDPVSVAVVSQVSGGGGGLALHDVAAANPKIVGVSSPNVLSPELIESPVAQGSYVVENPLTLSDGTSVKNYGYDGDGPLLPAPGDLPS